MVNLFTAMGRIKLIADDYIVLTSTNKIGREVNLKVFVRGNMMKSIREYTTAGDVCGVKGYFDISPEQKKLILVADKVSFLGREDLTKGDELLDE